MKKIIVIGECGLDVIYNGGQPVGSMPSGRLLNAAMMLSRNGIPVAMAGDMGADALGDIIAKCLEDAGVNTESVDRYTEGKTPVTIFVDNQAIVYKSRDNEGFDIVWPRINPGDIVVYGGYYAIDPANHERLTQLIANAIDRKAFVVYLPGFMPQMAPRLTRVMPAILENLETANMIIARPADLELIYNKRDMKRCFDEHVMYYTPLMVDVDAASQQITACHRCGTSTASFPTATDTLLWNSAAVSAVIAALYQLPLENADNCTKQTLDVIVECIEAFLPKALDHNYPEWQKNH